MQGTECCKFEHSSGNIVHYVATFGNSHTSVSSSEVEVETRVEIYGRTAVGLEYSVVISNAAAYEGSFGLIA